MAQRPRADRLLRADRRGGRGASAQSFDRRAASAAGPWQRAAEGNHAHGEGARRRHGVPRGAPQQRGGEGALSPFRLQAGRGAHRLLPGAFRPRGRARPVDPAVTRREEILQEMGLGPVWRLKGKKAEIRQETKEHAPGWESLKARVKSCTDCKLRAGCTQTVFGVGDEKAEWLLVG